MSSANKISFSQGDLASQPKLWLAVNALVSFEHALTSMHKFWLLFNALDFFKRFSGRPHVPDDNVRPETTISVGGTARLSPGSSFSRNEEERFLTMFLPCVRSLGLGLPGDFTLVAIRAVWIEMLASFV
jgi:hypothetical protein